MIINFLFFTPFLDCFEKIQHNLINNANYKLLFMYKQL